MLDTLIGDYLFLETLGQLLLFGLIITLAGVVRGCIGFGFSAIVVASTSFWLPPVAVVNLVVLLEIAASINMLPTVYKEVKRDLLIPLTVGSLLTTSLGTWFLATLSADVLQWVI
ncbi:MAG: TSUP family transporter, partial [Candidatus Promineifilaceae bacterium]